MSSQRDLEIAGLVRLVEIATEMLNESHDQRDELQAMLTAAEEHIRALEHNEKEWIKAASDRNRAYDRIRTLEGALRRCTGTCNEDCNIFEHAEPCPKAALAPAPPADKCKWCWNPPAAGDDVCEGHRRLNESMSTTLADVDAVDDPSPPPTEALRRIMQKVTPPAEKCGAQHSSFGDYTCVKDKGHDGWHSCGSAPPAAVQNASDHDRCNPDCCRVLAEEAGNEECGCKGGPETFECPVKHAPPAETPAPTGGYWEGFAEAARRDAEGYDRLRADLATANEEIAHWRALATWCSKHSVLQPCQYCPDDRIVAKLGEETTRRSQMHMRLGRAVAALREEIQRHDNHCAMTCDAPGVLARAVLADDESKDAGEDWREITPGARTVLVIEAYLRELEAVYEAAPGMYDVEGRRALQAAVAAVDARRGQGAK